MELESLTAVSPVDGRYAARTADLREVFSEYALIRYRVFVELRWLEALAANPSITGIEPFDAKTLDALDTIQSKLTPADARRVKELERTANHDVKAVEYFIKEKIARIPALAAASEFVHFALTSEDVNNLSYALMLRDARRDHVAPALHALIEMQADMAETHAELAMLSRTHGQAASPTTLGKEMALFAHRLQRQLHHFESVQILGKCNGAVGNFNAHLAAYPDVDWMTFSREFVESLGLGWNPNTTQIEPHDWLAEYFHVLSRLNTILIDYCRDIWGYISLGYFRQRAVEGETGSSTMPHKVNPIDFENAEGNLGLANALFEYLAAKLPISRWQRDLTDSTTLRSVGTAVAHCMIAYASVTRGNERLEADPARIGADLENAWEVLTEAVQTVMRSHGIEQPYEKLKALSRGRALDRATLHEFIEGLALPEDARRTLTELTPATYTGNAAQQARDIATRVRLEN